MPDGKRTKPCDACRRRKTRCVTEDGDQVCVRCRFHSQQCRYTTAARGNKKRKESLANASATDERGKRVRSAPGTGVEEYDALPGTTLLRRTLGLLNVHHARYLGLNDAIDAYGLEQSPGALQAMGSARPGKVRPVHPLHAFHVIPDAESPGHREDAALTDEIERTVEGDGPELVTLYFAVIHPAFPILHKDVFFEKYARSYKEFSPPLLAAVYLLACEYWRYSQQLSGQPLPQYIPKLRLMAHAAFQSTMRRPKLSTVQAGLLMSQYSVREGHVSFILAGLDLTAQLVELCYTLGLHLDSDEWDIPDWEISLRRRLSWAVFMQDKWTSLLSGRPSRLSGDDWEVHMLDKNDFPEQDEIDSIASSEVHRGRLVFIKMAELTQILADVLKDLFSARSRRQLNVEPYMLGVLLSTIKPLQIRLRDWYTTLPESLKLETVAAMKLSSVGYLRLAYLTLEVCLHRQVLLTMQHGPLSDPALGAICRKAAKERFNNAVDFVRRLQAIHLASFWYFSSAQCCVLIYHLGRLLAAMAENDEQRAACGQKVEGYLFTLKINGQAGAAFMTHALSMIEHSNSISWITSADRSITTSPADERGSMLQGASTVGSDAIGAFNESASFTKSPFGEDEWHFDFDTVNGVGGDPQPP